jgi:hypothetical protein
VRKKKERKKKKQSCEKVEKPKTLIKFTKQYQIIKICIQNVTGVFFFLFATEVDVGESIVKAAV